jgi:hypothetical protein
VAALLRNRRSPPRACRDCSCWLEYCQDPTYLRGFFVYRQLLAPLQVLNCDVDLIVPRKTAGRLILERDRSRHLGLNATPARVCSFNGVAAVT